MKVLITNPDTDNLTHYLYVWSQDLIKKHHKQHSFIHLVNKKVNRKRVCGTLEKKNIDVVFFHGHGSDGCIMGCNEIIFNDEDVKLLKGKIIHTLSCHTAKKLGLKAKGAGARVYLGYDEKFVALMQSDKASHPVEDDTAALFLDPAFTAPAALLTGKTGSEAVSIAKKAYNKSIISALNSDIQSDNDQFIGWLLWDRDHLVAC